VFVALGGCVTPIAERTKTYVNPVINSDFPDPTVIKAGDGLY
jgi:beta-xylosidase